MFRIQFTGDSETEAEEHCHNCMQKLAEYIPVQVTDAIRQELHQSHCLLLTDESQMKDTEQNVPLQDTVSWWMYSILKWLGKEMKKICAAMLTQSNSLLLKQQNYLTKMFCSEIICSQPV